MRKSEKGQMTENRGQKSDGSSRIYRFLEAGRIQRFRELGIEGILPAVSLIVDAISFNLLILSFNPSIPEALNP